LLAADLTAQFTRLIPAAIAAQITLKAGSLRRIKHPEWQRISKGATLSTDTLDATAMTPFF